MLAGTGLQKENEQPRSEIITAAVKKLAQGRETDSFPFFFCKASRILYLCYGKAVLGLLNVCLEFGHVNLVEPMLNLE